MRGLCSGFAEFREFLGRLVGRVGSLGLAAGLAFGCGPASAGLRGGAETAVAPAAGVPAAPVLAPARRVRVTYQAPPECPGYDAYVEHVARRSAKLRLESEPAATGVTDDAVRARVTLDRSSTGWVGLLSLDGVDALERRVQGERCEDVVAALALITVLRLERSGAVTSTPRVAEPTQAPPDVSMDGRPEPSRPEAPGPAEAATSTTGSTDASPGAAPPTPSAGSESAHESAPVPPPSAAVDTSRPASGAALASPEPPLRPAREPEPPFPQPEIQRPVVVGEQRESVAAARPAPAGSTQTSLIAQVGYASVPSDALKLALTGELRAGPDGSNWAGALSLALAHGNAAGAAGSAALTLLTAQLDVCPPGLSLPASTWLQACAMLRGGAMQVSVSPVDRPLSSVGALRPWAAVGPSLKAGLPLSSAWSARGLAELGIQFVRDSFYSERPAADANAPPAHVTLYRPSILSYEFGVGLAYTF
jgi:hypothetical protein